MSSAPLAGLCAMWSPALDPQFIACNAEISSRDPPTHFARPRLRTCGTAQRNLCILRNVIPHVRSPVCCVKYGPSDPLCGAQYDCTQRFHTANIQKAAIGGLRTKNYSNDAFPEVLRLTSLRAAAATPIRWDASSTALILPAAPHATSILSSV
jgi:hypothetical protein